MKRLIFSISAGIATALGLIQLYCRFLHPEICYFRNADSISCQWEQKLRRSGRPCTILGGGSEVRSSLSPDIMMQETGVQAVNTATAAPFGLAANASIALHHVQPGDTLLLSVISAGHKNVISSEGGIKLAHQLHGFSIFNRGGIPLTPETITAILSSDAASALISAVRKCTRGYTYVYAKEATLHPDGWMEVHRRGMENARVSPVEPTDSELSDSCVQTLNHAKKTCEQIGADFIVMFPVGYNSKYETTCRLSQALQIIRMGIPVLKDERLGCITDTRLLADTHYHLNTTGTAENSRIIARLLQEKSYWSEQEVLERLQKHKLNEPDTRHP